MSTENLQGKRILYVEDDSFLADLMLKKFESIQATVENATSGEEAVKMIQDKQFDCVLLDLLLPKMSGLDVLKTIKEDQKTAHIPVVVFSNLGADNDIERAKELGADRFLVKSSVVPDDVPGVLNEILEGIGS